VRDWKEAQMDSRRENEGMKKVNPGKEGAGKMNNSRLVDVKLICC
jgi:hypothetical protein